MDMILTKTPRKKESTRSLLGAYTMYYEEIPTPQRTTSLEKLKKLLRSFTTTERQTDVILRTFMHQ